MMNSYFISSLFFYKILKKKNFLIDAIKILQKCALINRNQICTKDGFELK